VLFGGKVLMVRDLASQWGLALLGRDPERIEGLSFCYQRFGGLVFVVPGGVFVGAGELFEEVGVLDGARDFVVSAGPLAEVDAATAVGAEGEVFAAGQYDGTTGGAAKGFGFRGGCLRHGPSLILSGAGQKRRGNGRLWFEDLLKAIGYESRLEPRDEPHSFHSFSQFQIPVVTWFASGNPT
jgi:hypothetical protein